MQSDSRLALAPSHVRLAARPALSRRAQRQAFRAVLLVSDGLMLALAFGLAYWLRFDLQLSLSSEGMSSPEFYTRLVLLLVPLWLGLFALFRLYDFRSLLSGTTEYAQAFNAGTVGMMIVVTATFLEPTFVIARGWLLTSWLLSVGLICCTRFLLRRAVYALRRYGYFVAPTAIVGVNGEAIALADQLRDWGGSGLDVVGLIDVGPQTSMHGRFPYPLLGTVDDVEEIARLNGIEELVIATTAVPREALISLFERVAMLPNVTMRLSSGLFEVITTGVQVQTLGFVPLMSLNRLRLEPAELVMKTALDYGLATLAVLLLAPVFAAIALMIRLDSPGPIFYRRRVLGVHGATFHAFKFRTMRVDGDSMLEEHPELLAELRATHKVKRDPRLTPLGPWLRKYSLDELPQLVNVLLGQMSLVGPRMITPAEAEKYGRLRTNLLTVKPGMTGIWQVSGRSDLSYEERVRLDMYYIRNYTIWRDLQILFIQTIPVVFRGRGAY